MYPYRLTRVLMLSLALNKHQPTAVRVALAVL